MTTLYNRATPAQARMLRIIEGAIRNARHAHPDLKVSERHARSIAKRAAGTLSSQWGGVLAERGREPRGRPERATGDAITRSPGEAGDLATPPRAGRHASSPRRDGERLTLVRRSPLSIIAGKIGHEIGRRQSAGKHEEARALIAAVRIVAAVVSCETSEKT